MFFRVPTLVQLVFNRRVWKGADKNTVYLTFDDGPDPETTPWVLSLLKKESVKATFFCIGKNIEENPMIFKQIIAQGHAIGNHTYGHEKGSKTKTEDYLKSIKKTEQLHPAGLFRPPYGRANLKQVNRILSLGKKVIMWTWNSQDYKKEITADTIVKNARKIKGRDILLFHNSEKSKLNMQESLPGVIEIVRQKELNFSVL